MCAITHLGVKSTFATDVTLGSYAYTVHSNTEFIRLSDNVVSRTLTYSSTINDPVGFTASPDDNLKPKNIVVSDADGNKMQIYFNSKGFINSIVDSKNGKTYESNVTSAALGSLELQTALNDLGKISGYNGDLFKDVWKQKNIYYNKDIIAKLQSAPADHVARCDVNSTFGTNVREAVVKGGLSSADGDAMQLALKGQAPWTRDLATKFSSIIYAYLGRDASKPNEDASWFDVFGNLSKLDDLLLENIQINSLDEAKRTIECADVAAMTQDERTTAIGAYQKLNEGGGTASLSGTQLGAVKASGGGLTAGGGAGSAPEVAGEVSGAVNSPAQDDSNEKLDQCFKLEGYIPGFTLNPSACFAEFLYFILSILAFFLGAVGLFFNTVFDVTLVNMKANVNSIGIVSTGWATIRDFANILFIFMLLYLAISTILQLDDHGVKKGLSRLIVGAVLINFSLFFVKIPIDISNLLAIEIYDTMKVNGTQSSGADSNATFGLGDTLMAMFSPQKVFDNSSLDPKTINQAAANKKNPEEIGWNLKKNPVTTFAMGIVVIFTALLIFLSVCIIFIKRFITLIMLMIFSPLAFAGMAVPNHDIEHQISNKFWGSLLRESFYAPVFMFMMYLTIKTGESLNTLAVSSTSQGWLADLTTVPVANVISYSVVIGMMIFSLTVSETMGVKGASAAVGAFEGMRGWTAGWVGKNTAGTLAYNLLEKHNFGTQTLKQMRQGMIGGKLVSNPVLRGITRGLGNSITSGLGKAGEGHHHDIERDMASTKDTLNELRDDPEKQAALIGEMMKGEKKLGGLIHPYDQKVAKYVGTEMKDDQVAAMVQFMKDAGKDKEAAALVDYLGKDRRRNVQELIDNSATRYHKVKLGDYADGMRLADEWQNNHGVIKVDDGHGGTDTLSGAEAIKHMRENYDAIDANNPNTVSKSRIESKLNTLFENFSEKQTTGILQGLSSEQQKTLSEQPAFQALARQKLTNFRMIETAMKNGMEKPLQDELSKVAYEGLARTQLADKLRMPGAKNNHVLQAEWKAISNGIDFDDYESGFRMVTNAQGQQVRQALNTKNDDMTFANAKQNFTRFASSNKEYENTVKEAEVQQEITKIANKSKQAEDAIQTNLVKATQAALTAQTLAQGAATAQTLEAAKKAFEEAKAAAKELNDNAQLALLQAQETQAAAAAAVANGITTGASQTIRTAQAQVEAQQSLRVQRLQALSQPGQATHQAIQAAQAAEQNATQALQSIQSRINQATAAQQAAAQATAAQATAAQQAAQQAAAQAARQARAGQTREIQP
ncbi:MAG: hypothetical protein V4469_03675 [Patescibacteria group bacterium]